MAWTSRHIGEPDRVALREIASVLSGAAVEAWRRWLSRRCKMLALTVVVLLLGAVGVSRASGDRRTVVTLRPGAGHRIPAGFVGLSLEYSAIEAYAGHEPAAINPVFEKLVRNLTLRQPLVLRIGGDSTDWAWRPVRHMRRPPGVTFSITDRWLAVTRAVASALRARLILGVNLEADSVPLATAEAKALIAALGRNSVEALELGNEPELYHSFGWYRAPSGAEIPGRPAGYGFPMFDAEFSGIARALGPLPMAGPATGASRWLSHWGAFLARQPRLRIATLHRYGLHDCTGNPDSPGHPTPAHLLSRLASEAPAVTARPFVAIAHSHGLPLRIDEMNSTPCYNVAPATAQSFASALWAIDSLFEMANVGADGVNIHTYPGAAYGLFSFRRVGRAWQASVGAEYYGLLMFARAAPAGSRLLSLGISPRSAIRAWATSGYGHVIRVTLINDTSRRRAVTLTGFRAGPAAAEVLRAPSIGARYGVTLGGQTFGVETGTGSLGGQVRLTPVPRSGAVYSVTVPADAAMLVTIRS